MNQDLEARCNSKQCVTNTYSMCKYIVKDVSKNTVFCPSCGSALFWCKKAARVTRPVISSYGEDKASKYIRVATQKDKCLQKQTSV